MSTPFGDAYLNPKKKGVYSKNKEPTRDATQHGVAWRAGQSIAPRILRQDKPITKKQLNKKLGGR